MSCSELEKAKVLFTGYESGGGRGMYSRLSRRNTARGSITHLVTVGPTKVTACKSVLFNIIYLTVCR